MKRNTKLGLQLRDARKRRGVSLRVLSEGTGLALGQIIRYEAARTVPRVETVEKVARALNADVVVGPRGTRVELLP